MSERELLVAALIIGLVLVNSLFALLVAFSDRQAKPERTIQQAKTERTIQKENHTADLTEDNNPSGTPKEEYRAVSESAPVWDASHGQDQRKEQPEALLPLKREQLIEQLSAAIYTDATQPVKADSELAKRYLAAVETLTGYLAEDSGRALKLVETLETMAKEGNAVNVDLYINSSGMTREKRP